MTKEESCIVLDFLTQGYGDRRHAEPIAQVLGKRLSLLEVVMREGMSAKPSEEVYIGDGPRDKVRYIKRSLRYDELTNFARGLLNEIVAKLVSEDEAKFVNFFNTATAITPRMHQLELMPGLGKKHVQDILSERRKKPFESYKDLVARVNLFPDPVKAVIKRIMLELGGKEKYYIFVPVKARFDFAGYRVA